MNRILLIIVVSYIISLNSCLSKEEFVPPNIVLFYIDDLGSKDLGCYGSPLYQTPTIDSLSQIGVRFTNAYSACTVCSPSRAALMTGKYPARLHLTDWISGWNFPYSKLSIPEWTKYLPLEETTIAELLKEKGYQTWHVGKWHLGHDAIYWPENQGFDVNIAGNFKGAPKRNKQGCNGYFSPYCLDKIKDGPEGEYLTDRLTDEAVNLINNSKDQPFFLNLSHYAVHTPIQAKEDQKKRFQSLINDSSYHHSADYAAMIYSVDQSVNKVIAALKKQGKFKNTLLIFTSDNGAVYRISPAPPLKKGKGHHYEGGVRIPLIAYWPGKLEGGEIIQTPNITMDVSATILSAAGYDSAHEDGLSLDQLRSERPIFWHYPHYHRQGGKPHSAVRLRNWKLLHLLENDEFELYNISIDPGEENDLANENPQKLKELKTLLSDWKKDNNAQDPTPNPNYLEERANETGPYIE